MEGLEGRRLLSANMFTVSNLNTSGAGSLNQAITDANAATGASVITFAQGVTGAIGASDLPTISAQMTIDGPGTGNLAINTGGEVVGGGTFTVGSGGVAEIEGLTVAGTIGNSGSLTVANCIVSGSEFDGIDNAGTLIVNDSTISGNGSFIDGSKSFGISNNGGAVTVLNSTISTNAPGGINNLSGSLAVTNCTITGQGSIGIENAGSLTVTDSTISGNGAGITTTTPVTLNGTIVAANNTGNLFANTMRDLSSTVASAFSGSHDLIGDGSDAGSLTASQRGTPADPLNPLLGMLSDNGGSTETLGLFVGSPAIGNGANFPVMDSSGNDITATDQRGTARPQAGDFDIGAYQTVGGTEQPPEITSAAQTNFLTGVANTFTIESASTPAAALSESGALPAGVTFVDNGNSTATLSGEPAAGTAGVYGITIKAKSSLKPNARQAFSLTVTQSEAPVITSANNATVYVGGIGSPIHITTTGFPVPRITETGTLPTNTNFVDNHDGTATITSDPVRGSGAETFEVTLKAKNGVKPNAKQTLTLTVDELPAITSGNNFTFTVGQAGVFDITTTGFPLPKVKELGALPAGLKLAVKPNGTAKLRGTPAPGTVGMYSITFRAKNSLGQQDQAFTLVVAEASSPIFTPGVVGSESGIAEANGTDAIILSGAGDDTLLG